MMIYCQMWGESGWTLRQKAAENLRRNCTGVCIQSRYWVKINERFWAVLLEQGHQVSKLGLCFSELPSLQSTGHKQTMCMRCGRWERSISCILSHSSDQSSAPATPSSTPAPPDLGLRGCCVATAQHCHSTPAPQRWTCPSKCWVAKYSPWGINQTCSSSCHHVSSSCFSSSWASACWSSWHRKLDSLAGHLKHERWRLWRWQERDVGSSFPPWLVPLSSCSPPCFPSTIPSWPIALPTSAPAGDAEATGIPELFSQLHYGRCHSPIRNPVFYNILSVFASWTITSGTKRA